MVSLLQPVLTRMGGHDDAPGILNHALQFMDDEALLEETITLFAEFLPAVTWPRSSPRCAR